MSLRPASTSKLFLEPSELHREILSLKMNIKRQTNAILLSLADFMSNLLSLWQLIVRLWVYAGPADSYIIAKSLKEKSLATYNYIRSPYFC